MEALIFLPESHSGSRWEMLVSSSLRYLLFVLSVVTYSFGQNLQEHPRPMASTAEKVSLSEVSTVQVSSLPAESIVAPLLCDPDGRILFRLAMPDTGVEDPISVSRDGRKVIRFGSEKINDVPQPQENHMFLSGSDVYVLTIGQKPLGHDIKLRTRASKELSQQAVESSTFVAHFEGDGRYVGAVRLELPFEPQQLGVFADGDFLIAGAEQRTYEPRVAIVGSDGQLRRFVELEGDVHAKRESDTQGAAKDPTALPSRASRESTDSLFSVAFTSQITEEGQNLLLYRRTGLIYSVSPSGEVQVHRLKVEGGDYRLFAIKVSGRFWIIEFLRQLPHDGGQEFATFAFDPVSGRPLREYFFPKDLGWGLACTDGDEFTFVMANGKSNSLSLVTLSSAGKP